MTYTGSIPPGGIATRSLTDLDITKLSVGPMDNNAYLLCCRATDTAVLIDAAAEPDRLLAAAAATSLKYVVTTHRHRDHWQGLTAVTTVTGAQALAHPDDASALPMAEVLPITDGETITVGAITLQVIHLVGHTPGSIALRYRDTERDHIWTGDSLFPGGPGRTTSPTDFQSLMTDLENKIFAPYDDRTWIYPGHGADTTLGAERGQLGQWWRRGW